ncbi:MAG TPA: hypothetical protein VKB34_21395, partial [Povalibacter sp.]|nr:hypothetical protein [Povalibacter sp.]
MRMQGAGVERNRLGQWLLACLWLSANVTWASTAPPHDYYVLSPEPLSGPVSVMSLEPGNTITAGSSQVTLQQYETASIPAAAFTSGTKFSGTGFFTAGSNQNAADLLVPDDFAGTAFVIPHIAGSHRYFFLSPVGNAEVTIRIGATTAVITANQGVVNEFDAGSDNTQAGRITSTLPIVVTHTAYLDGVARDAYPVPPAATDMLGVRSQNTVIAALNSGTSVTVYASDATSSTYTLAAGEQVTVTNGLNSAQGLGSALHVVASGPVAAVEYDDGDGNDSTAFWSAASLGTRHGIPVNAQYLAVACNQPGVTLTLYKGRNAPETQSCS